MKKVTKTLRFTPKLIADVQKLAELENRNFNNYVETVLLREVAKHTNPKP